MGDFCRRNLVFFKTIPLRTAWHFSVSPSLPLSIASPNRTFGMPFALSPALPRVTCVYSSSQWRLHCEGRSSAVMWHVTVIDSSTCIMSCSLNGCKGPSGAGEVTASMVRKLLLKSPSEDTQPLPFCFPRQKSFCSEYNRHL